VGEHAAARVIFITAERGTPATIEEIGIMVGQSAQLLGGDYVDALVRLPEVADAAAIGGYLELARVAA
jgi:hypothetical protein